MWQSWWGGPLVLVLVLAGPPGPALRSRNQDPGIGDRPVRGPAADRAGVRISARRDLAAELPVRRSVLDGNRQILGDQPGATSHKAVLGQFPSGRLSGSWQAGSEDAGQCPKVRCSSLRESPQKLDAGCDEPRTPPESCSRRGKRRSHRTSARCSRTDTSRQMLVL